MRVIFNEKFLKDINEIGNTIFIKNISFGKYYRKIQNISEIFFKDYINGDEKLTDKININSIWEKEKILKLNIKIENNLNQLLIENNYELIYCFYKNLVEEDYNIAFILTGDINKDETGYLINNINLSINSNIINVPFPDTTKGNILTSMNEDTIFLEGIGIQSGINVLRLIEESDIQSNKHELISRGSYFKKLYDINCNKENFNIPFLNTTGEKVLNLPIKYLTVTNLSINTENTEYDEEIPIDRSLDVNGGSIYLLGKYDYTISIINQNKINKIDSTITNSDLSNLKGYEIEIVEDGGLVFSVNDENLLSYEKNSDPNNSLFAIIRVYYNNIDINTGKITRIYSNELKLIQGQGGSFWSVKKNTPYSEDNVSLYLLNSELNSSQEFYIDTNLDISLDQITISPEDVLGNEFFRFETEKKEIDSEYKITIKIIAKKENNSVSIWNPSLEVEEEIQSKLIKFTLSYEEKRVYFYCVQKYKTESMKLYEKIGDGQYQEISEVILPNKSREKVVYFGKITSNDGDNNYWKTIKLDNELITNPDNGELNSYDTSSWEVGSTPKSFKIITDSDPNFTGIKELGSIDFIRLKKDLVNLPEYSWKDAITFGNFSINIKLKGQDPSVELSTDSIILKNLGYYKFYVKSNSPTTMGIIIDSDYQNYLELVFNEGYSQYYELNDFNNSVGLPVLIRLSEIKWDLNSFKDKVIGKLLITTKGVEGNQDSKTLNLYVDTSETPFIEKTSDTTEEKLFVSSGWFHVYFKTNRSTDFSSTKPVYYTHRSDYYVNSQDLPENWEYGYGYLYSDLEIDIFKDSYLQDKYPISKYCTITIPTIGNPVKNISYDIYIKGIYPSIDINNAGGQIFVDSENESFYELKLTSVYQLASDDIITTFDSDKRFEFKLYQTGTEDDKIQYNIRITALQENTSTFSVRLGNLKIYSRIKPNEFVEGEIYDQGFINKTAGVGYREVQVWQSGRSTTITEPEIKGDTSNINFYGGSRYYYIIGNNYTISSVSLETDYDQANISEYNQGSNNFQASFPNRIENYSPILITNSNYIDSDLIKNIGFNITANINTAQGESFIKSIYLIQDGFYYGIIYRSSTISNTLFLGESEKNVVEEVVDNSSTELTVGLGLFPLYTTLNTGTNIQLTSESGEEIIEFTETPSYSESGNYNVKISFQPNHSPVNKVRTILGTSTDSNGYTHEIVLKITQGEKIYLIKSSKLNTGDNIKFHSSGYCNQTTSLGVVDDTLETNIPRNNFKVWSDDLEILEYDLTYISQGSSSDLSKYKLSIKISPNKTNTLKTGEIYLGYDNGSAKEKYFTLIAKQGYLNVYLESPTNSEIINENIESPIFNVPARDQGTEENERIIFPVKVFQREVNDLGELGEIIQIPKENCGISGNDMNWSSTITNDLSDIFNSYKSKYFIEDDKISENKWPFIENQYITKESYYSTQVPIKAIVSLYVTYPDIEERSEDYRFILNLIKLSE